MKRLLALTLATSALVLAGPPSAEAYTCLGQGLTIGADERRKIGIDDEGENVYFKADQTGKGKRCTGGRDVFGRTDMRITWGSCWIVNGAWVNFAPVAGVDPPKQRVECGEQPWVSLGNRTLAKGQGDRRGGAKITIDRRWPASNITFYVEGQTQG